MTTTFWNKRRINIIDTPGHVDFTLEVERALRVLDGAICLFDSVAGVEPQSETVWRQADKYGVPRICFVNKIDCLGANFFRIKDMIVTNLDAKPPVIQLSIGSKDNFQGVVDLVKMKAVIWSGEELGVKFVYQDISVDLQELAQDYHSQMIEAIVKLDDKAMENYLEGYKLDEKTTRKLIRKGTIFGSFVPVLCGSTFKNKWIQPLLNTVVDYLPSPLDLPVMKGNNLENLELIIEKTTSDEPFAGLAFKIMIDPFVGSFAFVRIYARKLLAGSYLLNANKGKKERIGKLLEMHANSREDIKVALIGDIIAFAGLKDNITDGSYHDVDSCVLAFQLVARRAFKEGIKKASARILEPIMKVEVITVEEHLGDVIGDLNSRRGQINSFGDKPRGLKYVSTLRGMTKGRASYTMQLAKFDVVPQHIQNQLASKEEKVAA
ncbi:hypothetical protein SLEP1_g8843 [Rubroshorea leprosula]|uniref:Tr-type G domain-containing protein n=1 Tax=Rubroshorea leprosula TaxID=152421 RepID=A0AAV5I7H9_9ROSI|nr:hypothetical protein SLEP1_g8843 [Rubroshorea leprosula]